MCKSFEQIRADFGRHTLVDDNRQRIIYDLVQRTNTLSAPMAEVGVYKGGSSYMITNADPNRLLYACDSFEGLPEADKTIDLHNKGDMSDTSFEDVCELLKPFNVKVIKGFFPNPSMHAEMYASKYSFVHLDVDLYHTMLECLNFFYPRLTPGGVIVIDDYEMDTCPGVKKAVDEFLAQQAKVPKHLDPKCKSFIIYASEAV